jgi:hypothetical protein
MHIQIGSIVYALIFWTMRCLQAIGSTTKRLQSVYMHARRQPRIAAHAGTSHRYNLQLLQLAIELCENSRTVITHAMCIYISYFLGDDSTLAARASAFARVF